MIFFPVQLGWMLFSYLSGPEEAAWTWPFRKLPAQYDFTQADKDEQSDRAHKFGWLAVASIGITLSACLSFAVLGKLDILFSIISATIMACEYSVLFDGSYALSIGQNFYYTGNTAKTDKRIQGKGKLKFFVLTALIIALNIIIKICWHFI